MGAMLEPLLHLQGVDSVCILSWEPSCKIDFTEGRVRHVSFGCYSSGRWGVSVRDRRRVQEVVLEFKPDIVHILGTEGRFAALPKFVFEGCPVVVSLQGIMAMCGVAYNGFLTPWELRPPFLSWSFIRNGFTILREQKFWMTVRASSEMSIFRRHHYFIGRTTFDKAWVAYYNNKAQYYHVDEILRPQFYDEKVERSHVVRHTLFCGGAAAYPLKGCHWLLRALAALKTKYPDVKLRIANAEMLDGKISWWRRIKAGTYVWYLRKLICEFDIADNVVALPALSADGVKEELQKAELFVLPSVCENSPNAIGEAMMLGTPVIASYVGGIPSIVSNNETARLIPPADAAYLAGTIDYLFEHPRQGVALAAKARKTALKRHCVNRNTQALLSAYESILEGTK